MGDPNTASAAQVPATAPSPTHPEPRGVDAGRGVSWIGEAFTLFGKAWLMWILLALAWFVITIVVGFVPFLGNLVMWVLHPVFLAGWLWGCRIVEGGGELELGHLFTGFQQRTKPLLILGVLYMLASLAIIFVMFLIGGSAIAAMALGTRGDFNFMQVLPTMLIALLVGLALWLPVLMALWFAPALVLFDDMEPVQAAKVSFAACLKNFIPFLIYGVVGLVLIIVGSIPLGLGLLAVLPVLGISVYTSYRDIFSKPAPVAAS